MTICEAAEVLRLSERQVKHIKRGVKEYGEASVIYEFLLAVFFFMDFYL
jgi:hypothetical protein